MSYDLPEHMNHGKDKKGLGRSVHGVLSLLQMAYCACCVNYMHVPTQ